MLEFLNEGIYCITNKINNNLYIGHSTNLGNRKTKHFSLLKHNKHPNDLLQKDYNIYNESTFEFKILEYTKQNLLEKEQYYINIYKPNYNIYINVVNYAMPQSVKDKLSITRKKLYKQGVISINGQKNIIQKDVNNNIIEEFPSIMSASRKLNINRSSIQKVLYGIHKQTNNFIFEYKED